MMTIDGLNYTLVLRGLGVLLYFDTFDTDLTLIHEDIYIDEFSSKRRFVHLIELVLNDPSLFTEWYNAYIDMIS